MIQTYGDHGAYDKKLTLGEIDYPGGVVNDVETYGNDSVYAANGNPRKTILDDLREIHSYPFFSLVYATI
jgi:hypothetical protein